MNFSISSTTLHPLPLQAREPVQLTQKIPHVPTPEVTTFVGLIREAQTGNSRKRSV